MNVAGTGRNDAFEPRGSFTRVLQCLRDSAKPAGSVNVAEERCRQSRARGVRRKGGETPMKKRFAIAILLTVGCASRPAPQPLQYAIATPNDIIARDATVDVTHLRALRANAPNDLLWFEHDGVQYIVTDAATVARATQAAVNVEREYAELRRIRPWGASPAVHYYTSGAASGAAPPEPAPNQQEYEKQQQDEMARTVDNQLPRYTADTSEEQFYLRKQQDSVARAEKNLRAILDAALRNGLAQPMS